MQSDEQPADEQQADEQLAEAAKQGSDAAFAELVGRYQERLLRFLITRCRSRADAEDALQDTFINAYRYLHSFNPRWRFSTWIYRIGIRNAARAASPAAGLADDVADPAADPLRECMAASDRENLWLTARSVLSDDAYTALWLRYVEDMSIEEVSTTTGRSASWAKVTLLRARRRIAAAFAEESANADKGELYG